MSIVWSEWFCFSERKRQSEYIQNISLETGDICRTLNIPEVSKEAEPLSEKLKAIQNTLSKIKAQVSVIQQEIENNGKQIQQGHEENEKLQRDNDELSRRNEELQEEQTRITQEKTLLEQERDALNKKLDALGKQLEELQKKDAEKETIALLQSIIHYRDQLFVQLEYAENDGNSEFAAKLTRNMLKITRPILTEHGVEILDGGGLFDVKTQQVYAVEPTEHEEEDKQIVSTYREGYLYKGKVLRYQEVTVKQYKARKNADSD